MTLLKRTCDRLEQTNFRCGYHERDFKVGMPISKNIRQCIKHSKKIVVLITPDFKDSEFCKYDLDIAVRPEILNAGRVIPLYMNLTSHDQIPDSLEVYTGLDVSAGQDQWWDKFVQAIDDSSREKEKDPVHVMKYHLQKLHEVIQDHRDKITADIKEDIRSLARQMGHQPSAKKRKSAQVFLQRRFPPIPNVQTLSVANCNKLNIHGDVILLSARFRDRDGH